MNYNINEYELCFKDITSCKYRHFIKTSYKTMINNGINLNEKYFTKVGVKYIFTVKGNDIGHGYI